MSEIFLLPVYIGTSSLRHLIGILSETPLTQTGGNLNLQATLCSSSFSVLLHRARHPWGQIDLYTQCPQMEENLSAMQET